jgi:flavin prenyltransferase
MTQRLVVGITGSTGVIYGIRLLEVLRQVEGIETHLVITRAGRETIALETGYEPRQVEALADVTYRIGDVAAAISSGSFRTMGMAVLPCTMKTAGALAASFTDNLLTRAADVTLKERRRLVLVVRETPLHLGHLRALTQLAEYGALIMPPMPAFYHRPQNVAEIVDQTVGRVLDQFDITAPAGLFRRWEGGVLERENGRTGKDEQ